MIEHRAYIYHVVSPIVRSPHDTEDVVQDVFLLIHRKAHLFRGESDFRTWVHRIAVNAALMFLRKKSKFMFVPLNDYRTPDPHDMEQAYFVREELGNALRKLRPDELEAFNFKYITELAPQERADYWGLTHNGGRMRTARMTHRLKCLL